MQIRPDFFIAGAPKCGTTAMDSFLGKHPEIFMAPVKELHYFGTDLKFNVPRINLNDYLMQFAGVKNEKRIGESSVWYLYSKTAAREIKQFAPSARIIIMLRNPVDMIHSQHSQLVYEGFEDIPDFEAALAAEETRKRAGVLPPLKGTSIEFLLYRETARYSGQLRRYMDIFGEQNVHVIIYDDFKNDQSGVYRDTLAFLDLEDIDFVPEFRIINQNKKIRSMAIQKMVKDVNHPVRKFIKKFVPVKMRSSLLERAHGLNVYGAARAPLPNAFRRKLQREFAPDIKSLGIMLKRDLSFWLDAGS
ncbi:MAG: sulfotransferase [Actinomycetota bacterium]|nr:sulfotransferase [Actinomycetota bacterium]